MNEDSEQPIDLNRLSQRELLILCATDIIQLKKEFSDLKREQTKMKSELIEAKAQQKVWGAVIGFVSGLLSGLLPYFFK